MDIIKDYLTHESFYNNIFVIFTIRFVILIIILKIAHIFINMLTKGIFLKISDSEYEKQIKTVVSTLKSVIDIVLSLIFVMEFLTKIGVDIGPILTAAGVLGVAVGFGAKRFVEDIISGFILILEGQIRVGDYIEINGKSGTVERLNLKMVVLRDVDGKVHYIRNGMIDIVSNYTRDYAYALSELGIAYKENVDNVIKIIKDIAENELLKSKCAKYIIGDLEMMGVSAFSDSSVNIKYRIKTKPMHQWEVEIEFNRLIKNKFDEMGIEMPLPQKTLYLKSDKNIEIIES